MGLPGVNVVERDLLCRLDPGSIMRAAGLEPDPWQDRILRSRAHRAIAKVHRQGGKSTTYAAAALHRALYPKNPRGALVLIFAAAQRQSMEVHRKIVELLAALRPSVGVDKSSESRLVFDNGSRIVALPATETTILGYSAPELVIIDEAARVPDILYASVRPMLAVSDGDLWLCSTPFGQRGFFHHEWTKGGDAWLRVEQAAPQCRRITAEFLAEERSRYPEWWYRQEYDPVEFADTEGQAISYELVMRAMGGVEALQLVQPPAPTATLLGGVEALSL